MKLIMTESAFNLLLEATANEIHEKYYNNIPSNIFRELIDSDPTTNGQKMGKYSKWIINLYVKNNLKLEDLYKVKEYLEYYNKYINKIEVKDINNIKSLSDLYKIISQFKEEPNQASSKSDEIRKIKEGADKVYEDSDWMVIIPKTKEASCYYGKGTQWCTAAENNNMFDDYNYDGKLYININKKDKKKYQFHFESSSFMDETDSTINRPVPREINMTKGLLEFYKNNINPILFKNLLFYKLERLRNDDEVLTNRYVSVLGHYSKSLLDENYNEISKEYKEINDFINNISIVKDIQDNLGLINIDGKELIKPKYKEIDYGRYGSNYIGLDDYKNNEYSIYDINKNEIVSTLNVKIYNTHIIEDNFYSSTLVDGLYLYSIYNIPEKKFITDYIFNTLPYYRNGPKTCEIYDKEKHEFVHTAEVQQNGDYKIID